MQAFYWDRPRSEAREGEWWKFVQAKVPEIAGIGITGLRLPPSAKSSHVDSMGGWSQIYAAPRGYAVYVPG